MWQILKTFQERNNPNVDNIFKSYLGYHDLQHLSNSPDYFEKLQKIYLQWPDNLILQHYLSLGWKHEIKS